jgi:hypothetical protein
MLSKPSRKDRYLPPLYRLEDRRVGWLIENWTFNSILLHHFWPADFSEKGMPFPHRQPFLARCMFGYESLEVA